MRIGSTSRPPTLPNSGGADDVGVLQGGRELVISVQSRSPLRFRIRLIVVVAGENLAAGELDRKRGFIGIERRQPSTANAEPTKLSLAAQKQIWAEYFSVAPR